MKLSSPIVKSVDDASPQESADGWPGYDDPLLVIDIAYDDVRGGGTRFL